MKKRLTFKRSALAVAVVMATGYVGSATAHYIPGLPTTTTAPVTQLGGTNAYDVYHSKCFTDNGGVGGIPQQSDSDTNVAALRMRAGVAGVGTNAEGLYRVTLGANRTSGVGGWVQNSCTDWNNTNNLIVGGVTTTNLCNSSATNNTDGSITLAPTGGTAGNGDYDIVVSHPLGGTLAQSAASPAGKGYNVTFHCEAGIVAAPLHTGTSSNGLWNGPDYVQQINY